MSRSSTQAPPARGCGNFDASAPRQPVVPVGGVVREQVQEPALVTEEPRTSDLSLHSSFACVCALVYTHFLKAKIKRKSCNRLPSDTSNTCCRASSSTVPSP